MSAVTYGRVSKRTVAIQCRGAAALWVTFSSSTVRSNLRTDTREGHPFSVRTSKSSRPIGKVLLPHQELDAARYNKLLIGTQPRFKARMDPVVDGQAASDYLQNHTQLSIWRWGILHSMEN